RGQEGGGIGAAGMMALSAAAIKRETLAAVAIDEVADTRGDFRNRCVPVDRIEAAIGAAPQRCGQAVAVMGVPGNPRGLVAEIAPRFRIVAVAADLADLAVLDQDLDAAIDIADVAGGLPPILARHRMVLPDRMRQY